jgi:ubiquinone/menaquinone biosynthesis C-methylase UbiE
VWIHLKKEDAKRALKALSMFDSLTGAYGSFQNRSLALVSEFEKMLVLLRISNSSNSEDSILEIGCGWGRYLSEVSESSLNRIGIDFSKQMLMKGKSKFPAIDFVQAEMGHLPLRDSSISLVYSVRAFKWSPNPLLVLKEVNRVCKKKGTVLFYEVINNLSIDFFAEQIFFWPWRATKIKFASATPFSTVKLFETAGFHNVIYKGVCFVPLRLYTFSENKTLLKILIALEKIAAKVPLFDVFAYGLIFEGNRK